MKKILITYDPSIGSDILEDRIRNLGKSYNFFKNQWVIATDFTTKEVYQKLSTGEFETSSIFVVEISSYYGRMNTSLWDWFKKYK